MPVPARPDRWSRRGPRTALRGGVVVLALAGGCSTSGLSFVQDDRVDIVAPGDREEVSLPITISWEAEDVGLDEGHSFGVVVDRAPPPAGRTLESLVDDDPGCRVSAGCPDEAYLAQRGVHRTTGTELVLRRLPQSQGAGRDLHQAIVVLLDEDGERIGESAWSVEFEVVRRG